MWKRSVWALVLVSFAAPMVHAASEPPWHSAPPHGMATSFGWVAMEPRVVYRGEDLELKVPILIHSDPGTDNATRFLFGFSLFSEVSEIDFVKITSNGTELVIDRDEREANPKQRRVMLAGADVPRDQVIELTALARAHRLGEHHVGVLVIAFDEQWQTLETSDGDKAQLYGFTMLRSAVTAGGPPVQGTGNAIEAFLLPILLSGGVLMIGLVGLVTRLVLVRRRRAILPGPT